jgi:hypothetical protein
VVDLAVKLEGNGGEVENEVGSVVDDASDAFVVGWFLANRHQ